MSESEDLLDPGVTKSNTNTGYSGQQKTIPNANAILVLGIISIVGCIFAGLPGLVCGIIALVLYKKVKATYESDRAAYESSFKNAKGGYVCAIIGTILSALYFVYFIVVFAFAASIATSNFGRF